MTPPKRPVGRPKGQPTAVIRIRLALPLHAKVMALGGDKLVKQLLNEHVQNLEKKKVRS